VTNNSLNILTRLRKAILEGEFKAGEKIAEIPVAERFNVSRTPVRLAFRTLEQEGLLRKGNKRGYLVREFTENDVQCALEIRGALEGLAARRLAEKGLSDSVREELLDCIKNEETLLAVGTLTEDGVDKWSQYNSRFHRIIIEESGSAPIADAIARNNHLPFASFDSLIIDNNALDKEYEKLRVAHLQHQIVVDALIMGEGARAEMLMREHAYIGMRYAEAFGLAKYDLVKTNDDEE
jgi:GntR family transcriptional regulator of vanillate catabolism